MNPTHRNTVSNLLYILAVIAFVLAAFGVTLGTVPFVAVGLAFFAAAHIVY